MKPSRISAKVERMNWFIGKDPTIKDMLRFSSLLQEKNLSNKISYGDIILMERQFN